MIIKDVSIRCCRHLPEGFANGKLKSSTDGSLEFVVVTLTTECGATASMFGFAGRSSVGAGHQSFSAFASFLRGKNALNREQIWHEWRTANRWWHHLPIFSYGPVDICLWLLASQHANQPLWQYLGGFRREIPVYASSLVLDSTEAYAQEALEVKNAGFHAYKIHPPGNSVKEDIEIHEAVREAVGPDFTLMSDPVAPYGYQQALSLGRALERLNYAWLEEPLPDAALTMLKRLRENLSIPLVGAEVIAEHPYSVAECIKADVLDAVRADVSWSGGITGALKTARLAEAFNMNCELHSTIFHPLEMVNMHLSGAIQNNSYLELLWPLETFDFGLKAPLPISGGFASLPETPGLGIELDWDLIDGSTICTINQQ